MPREWKYTAERDARDDWEGTQVTLSPACTKTTRKLFLLLSCCRRFCLSTFFPPTTILTFLLFAPYLPYQVFLSVSISDMVSVSVKLSLSGAPILHIAHISLHFCFRVPRVSPTSPPSGPLASYTVGNSGRRHSTKLILPRSPQK